MAKFLILVLAVLAILTQEVSANAREIPTTTTTTTTTTHAPSPIHLNATEPGSCLPPESAIDITARPGPHCRGLHWVYVTNTTWSRVKFLVKSGQKKNGKPMYVCRCTNCGPDDVVDQTFPGYVSPIVPDSSMGSSLYDVSTKFGIFTPPSPNQHFCP